MNFPRTINGVTQYVGDCMDILPTLATWAGEALLSGIQGKD